MVIFAIDSIKNITKVDILKNNLSEFNNSDNKPTQSTAYYVVEINK